MSAAHDEVGWDYHPDEVYDLAHVLEECSSLPGVHVVDFLAFQDMAHIILRAGYRVEP